MLQNPPFDCGRKIVVGSSCSTTQAVCVLDILLPTPLQILLMIDHCHSYSQLPFKLTIPSYHIHISTWLLSMSIPRVSVHVQGELLRCLLSNLCSHGTQRLRLTKLQTATLRRNPTGIPLKEAFDEGGVTTGPGFKIWTAGSGRSERRSESKQFGKKHVFSSVLSLQNSRLITIEYDYTNYHYSTYHLIPSHQSRWCRCTSAVKIGSQIV